MSARNASHGRVILTNCREKERTVSEEVKEGEIVLLLWIGEDNGCLETE
jgi:hypothetical protein